MAKDGSRLMLHSCTDHITSHDIKSDPEPFKQTDERWKEEENKRM